MLSSGKVQAQCENNNDLLNVFGAPATVGSSVGNGICIFAGESFRLINLQPGSTYRISACGSDPGLDSRITVFPSSGGAALAFNDDYCGLLSRLDFTSVDGSSIDILLDATGPGNTCISNTEICGSLIITLLSTDANPAYCSPQYASPFGGTTEGDFINGIALESINNQNTGAEGGPNYTHYSNLVTNLLPNTSYVLTVKNNPDYTEKVAAWIDYNQDLEFSSNERLGQITVFPGASGVINFTTPAVVNSGQTRLRVRMMNTIPIGIYMDPCGLATYGETEDYGVVFPADPAGPSDGLNFSTACGINKQIPDNACPNTTEASITVSGLSNLGEDHILESASIIIEHPMAADLDIYLQAPNGQLVELSTDNGGAGANYGVYAVNNCTQVAKFIMNAATPINGANAPFVGSYIPEGNLASLNSGLNPNGVWKLIVCDDFAGDVGIIQHFALGFKEELAGNPPACAATYSIADAASDIDIDDDISWTAGDGNPTSYDVYFGTSPSPALVSDNQSTSSYDPGTLLEGTTYYYQIVPSNAYGDATGCPVRSFTTQEATPLPGCAQNLSPTGSDVSVNTTINWEPGTGPVSAYNLFFGTDPGNLSQVLDEVNVTSYTPNAALNFSTTYYYLVVPVNESGTAENCTPASFTTESAPEPDGILMQNGTIIACDTNFYDSGGLSGDYSAGETYVLTIVPKDANSNVSVTFSSFVSESGALDGLAIYNGTQVDLNPLVVLTGTVSGPVTYTSSAPGGELTFAFNSDDFVNAAGWVATLGCEPQQVNPVCATNLSPADEATGVSTSSSLSWTSGGGNPDSYDVYFGTDAQNLVLVADNTTQTTYSPGSPLSLNTTYYWQIIPNYGNSQPSCSVSSFTTTSETGIIMADGSVQACSGTFYDSGGQNGNYGSNEFLTFTIFPSTPGSFVKVDFTEFNVSNSGFMELDNLLIINGSDAMGGDIIGSYTGTTSPGSITSYAADGALTFLFYTDAIGTASGWAASISCVTPTEAPACAVNLSPTDVSTDVSTDVVLSWEQGTGAIATGYSVWFGTDPGSLSEVASNQPGTTFAPQGLQHETTYYWQVVPQNTIGSATGCSILSFTTGVQAIECAQNFLPVNGTTGVGEQQIISWEAPASGGVTSYDVYFGTEPFSLPLVSDNQAGTSYTATGLLPGTTYYWQISPNGDNGSAINCTITSFITSSDEEVLCATNFSPFDLEADVDLNADLSWEPGYVEGPPGPPVPAFYTFDIYFGTAPDALVLIADDYETMTFDPGSLEPNTTYFWKVIPTKDGESAEDCPIISFTTGGEAQLTCVTQPVPANGATQVSLSTTEISWTPGQGSPETYDIYFGTDADNLQLLSDNQTETSFDVGMLEPNTTYYWYVQSFSADDSTDNCTVFSFSTLSVPNCVASTNPANAQTDVATDQVLSWDAVSGADAYDVYIGLAPDDLVMVSEDQAGTSFTPNMLQGSTTYFWLVVPKNEAGAAENCTALSFTTVPADDELVIFNGEVTTCIDTLYDTGGSTSNYTSGENITFTIYPATPGSFVKLDFLAFNTEDGWDSLYVYHGSTATGTPALELSGEILQNLPSITSDAANGSLTLVFRSDDSGTAPGFEAAISCFVPTEIPACAISLSPADEAVDQFTDLSLSWAAGDGNPSGYDVYFGTDPGTLQLVSENQPGTSFSPVLQPNTTYYWQIIPRNLNGAADACAIYSFTTGEEVTPNEILMHTGEVTTCNATFYDDGGLDNNYADDQIQILTIYPETPGSAVKVQFNSFASEKNFDVLYVFYGNDINAAPIDSLTGEDLGLMPTYVSNAADGSITFGWISDVNLGRAGWSAEVSCVDANEPLGCIENFTPANNSQNLSNTYTTVNWSPGAGIPSGYDVYFGTDPDNLTLVSDNQVALGYYPGTLQPATTYYWQVVPYNQDGSATDCPVNSFTTSTSIDILMHNGLVNTCDANFFDTGGPSSNYGLEEDSVLTICPDSPDNVIQVTFNSFNAEDNMFSPLNPYDYMIIYDGNSTSGTPFVNQNTGGTKFSGTTSPGTFLSTTDDGCLTFEFTSDDLFSRPGWDAKVICLASNVPPSCASINGPMDGDTGVCRNVTLSWSNPPGSIVTGYDVYMDLGDGLELVSDNQTGTSYYTGLLDSNTEYTYLVVPFNTIGDAVDCPVVTFTTGTCVTYCEAGVTGEDGCFEHIARVTVGDDIDNTSACPDETGYTDYSVQSAEVAIGLETPITIVNGEAYTSDSCGVWVDWNHDGDFDDANESITLNGQPAGPYTGLIIPPADAQTGPTRMRIRITDVAVNPNLDPCGLTVYGETEDYTLNVNPAPACPYPGNIVVGDITVSSAAITWNPVNNAETYLVRYRKASVSDTAATWVQPMQVSGQSAFTVLEGLDYCQEYIVQVGTKCADEEEVLYSSNIRFTSQCVVCPDDATTETETCGESTNGGCTSDVPAYQPISCGETICGTTYFDGTTRDTDWFSINVGSEETYSFNLVAEFDGSIFIVDVTDCDNPSIITQGPPFTANVPYTLSSNLQPGTYAVFVGPSFDKGNIVCGVKNRYTLTFNGGETTIAPVAPVCETTAPFNLVATPAGGNWSGTGITDANNGTFDPSVAGIGTFTITYNAVNNACATSATIDIVVTGNTTVAPQQATGPDSLCIDAADSQFSISPVSGVTEYLWVLTPTEAGSISGTGTTATVNWASNFTGTASVVAAAVSACGTSEFSVSKDIVIQSAPSAPAAIEGPATSCAGSQNYFSPGSGSATLSWSLNPSNAGTISGTGNTITVTWADEFSGSASLSVTATNFCGTSSATSIEINVLSSPFVDFVGLAAEYCSSDEPAVLSGIPAGGYFTITGGNGITGNVFNPAQAGAGTYTITYFNQIDGCQGSIAQNVTVITGPSVSISGVQDMCSNGSAVTLSGTPSGGTFSGPGVSGSSFNPAAVNPGNITLTYIVTDPDNECSGKATTSFMVNPAPSVNLIANQTSVCVNAGAVALTGVPSPGTFSGTGVTGNTFQPATAGIGVHTVRYTVDNGTCSSSDSLSITVTAVPELEFRSTPEAVCTNDGAIQLSSVPAGASFTGPGVVGSTFNPSLAGIGTHTLTATMVSNGCTSTATRLITVNRSPEASFNISTPGYTAELNNTSLYADSYLWDFGDSTTSTATNPTHTYAGNGFYTIKLIATNVLCGTDTFSVNVDISVGIGNVEGVDQLQVFPNPTEGLLNLSFQSAEAQTFDIRILDAAGRLVATESFSTMPGKVNRQYDLSDKAKGIYFFSIRSEKGMMNYRIVKD